MTMRLAVAVASLAICACSSSGRDGGVRSVTAAPSGDGDAIVGALADASLPKGECGMILWTLEADQPTPILKVIAGKGAEMVVNGKLLKFSVIETGGAAGFGVFEEQKLASEKMTADVRVRFALGFDGGSYLERGLVTIESPGGWRTVIPAAGVAGCRS